MITFLKDAAALEAILRERQEAVNADAYKAMDDEMEAVAPHLDALQELMAGHLQEGDEGRADDLDVRGRFVDGCEYTGGLTTSDLLVVPDFSVKDAFGNAHMQPYFGVDSGAGFAFGANMIFRYDFASYSKVSDGRINVSSNYMMFDQNVVAHFQSLGIWDNLLEYLGHPMSIFQHDYLHPMTLTFYREMNTFRAFGFKSKDPFRHFLAHNFDDCYRRYRDEKLAEFESWVSQVHSMIIHHLWGDADYQNMLEHADAYFKMLAQAQKDDPQSNGPTRDYYRYMVMQFLWPLTVVFPPHSEFLQNVVRESFQVDYKLGFFGRQRGSSPGQIQDWRARFFEAAGKSLDITSPEQRVLGFISAATDHVYEYMHGCYPYINAPAWRGEHLPEPQRIFNAEAKGLGVSLMGHGMHVLDVMDDLFERYDKAWSAHEYPEESVDLMPRSMRALRMV